MELFSWEALTTITASATLVYLIVSSTKQLPGIKNIPTFLYAVLISTIVITLATIAIGGDPMDWKTYALCFFNSWMVAAVSGKMNDESVLSMQNKAKDNIELK